ncbi:MAG: GNAT family N-acetyltransferase [Armatimonadota bacterium]|nr:MAG: GNAT family N-acetyltransferase [Armatimonadota bacterium]
MAGSAIHLHSAQPVVVETRDAFSRHGEELLVARYAPGVADRRFTWPATDITPDGYRDQEGLVAHVDGVVAGRAILETAFHPLAELVNLEVHPPYRGRGVGSAIVSHAIETAARAGFLAIHVQTFADEVGAHRLYARHGFLPATRGEMLRLWRFLNLPALAQFFYDHPLALFESTSGDTPRQHMLRWRDPTGEDQLAVAITGGSCQFDSDGIRPAVSTLRLRTGAVRLTAKCESQSIRVGESVCARIALTNEGSEELTGGFRIGLNPGFAIASDHPGGERFALDAGATLERALTITVEPSFPRELLCIASYWSVPVTVEVLLGDHTFWLTIEVRFGKPN